MKTTQSLTFSVLALLAPQDRFVATEAVVENPPAIEEVCWEFGAPRLVRGYCVSEAVYSCKSSESSASRKTFYAVPLDDLDCSSVRTPQDFFSIDLFEGDDSFLSVVAGVARILADAGSARLGMKDAGICDTAINELLERRMSAAVLLKISVDFSDDNKDRYEVIFRLPESGQTIGISINDDGSRPEWALLLR